MFEVTYKTNANKILKESASIWIYVLIYLAAEFFAVKKTIETGDYGVIIFVNLFFGTMTFCSIKIFINYLKHSAGKNFIITETSLKLTDDKSASVTEINFSDVMSLEFYSCKSFRPPWSGFEHIFFRGIDDKQIIVTSFMMDIMDFRLKKKFTSITAKPEFIAKVYPLIQ